MLSGPDLGQILSAQTRAIQSPRRVVLAAQYRPFVCQFFPFNVPRVLILNDTVHA